MGPACMGLAVAIPGTQLNSGHFPKSASEKIDETQNLVGNKYFGHFGMNFSQPYPPRAEKIKKFKK